VVDDNTDAAASLALLLQMEGHTVRTAADGVEAIEQFQTFHPDIVFMDLGMPRLDGVEAARRIRALPQGGHVRIVALTGWGQEADRQRTRDAGMDHHLVKPVSLEALRSAFGAGGLAAQSQPGVIWLHLHHKLIRVKGRIMRRYQWSSLNKQQVGVKMEFTMYGFQGIDFVARYKQGPFVAVQVKSLRTRGYLFMEKTKFPLDGDTYLAFGLLNEGQAPALFLIPSENMALAHGCVRRSQLWRAQEQTGVGPEGHWEEHALT
jgi:CheY-like chemotaxis protein